MKITRYQVALREAIAAARAAGGVMRRNLNTAKKVNQTANHDIKLELDVRCQRLIERRLGRSFPDIDVLGEEGSSGAAQAAERWVIDPIDGTVNYAHGIPHACVCIALQVRSRTRAARVDGGFATVVGVIYDPFLDELWSAVAGDRARLNGKTIHVSRRARLGEAVAAMGYSKGERVTAAALQLFSRLSNRTRKVRNMGSAGLALAYLATGRFDAYLESGISLWDIAAGGFIIECAGGKFWRERVAGEYVYRMIASNGRLHRQLASLGACQSCQ